MIKVGKLWGGTLFQGLSPSEKLLYLYLASKPQINILGLLQLVPEVASIETGMTLDKVRKATLTLVNKDKILAFKDTRGLVWFLIKDHYKSIAKSPTHANRVHEAIGNTPSDILSKMRDLKLLEEPSARKHDSGFVAPTSADVSKYAMSLGYKIDGAEFVNYYEHRDWKDSNKKRVKDWKAKVRSVWLRNAEKLEACEGAPRGMEYYYLEHEGEMIFPDRWKDGKPWSKDFLSNRLLKDNFIR